jgi:pimeloyl-ACP methyl ester carboxylesterase
MAPLDRVFGRLSRGSPWIFTILFSMLGAAAAYLSPQVFIRSLSSSLSAADKALLQDPELASCFSKGIQEAFRQGAQGPAEDALLLYREWGFAVEDVSAPVEIFHGTEDQFASAAFGRYLDERIPNSTLHLFPGRGHLFFMMQFERILQELGKAD